MNPEIMAQDIKDIKDQLSDMRVLLAELPQKVFEKADERYASKSIEEDVKQIKSTQESRVFDWLKYTVAIIVGIVLTLAFGKLDLWGL